jgi:hypothetical protein
VVAFDVFGLDDLSDAAVVLGLVLAVTFWRAALLLFAGWRLFPTGLAAGNCQLCVQLLVAGLEFLDVGL